MTEKAKDIEQAMLQFASEKQAKTLMRFFKTGKGQYGEGDHFLGVTNPQTRSVVKESWKNVDLEDAVSLVKNKWHEIRLCGLLIMVELFLQAKKKKDDTMMREIFKTYTTLHPYINNWDLVDLSTYKIVGFYECLHPEETLMDEWIKPGHTLWQQRIAMVAAWQLVRINAYDKVTERAEILLTSKENLLHKAAGWVLREMYKHDDCGIDALECFLEKHIGHIPPVMLSYACEKMCEKERAMWRGRNKSVSWEP